MTPGEALRVLDAKPWGELHEVPKQRYERRAADTLGFADKIRALMGKA